MVVDVKIYFNTGPIIKKTRKLCINFMRDNTSKSLNAEHTPKIGKRFGLHTLRAAFLGLLPVLCSYMGSVLFTVFFDYSFSPEMGSLEIVEIFSIDLQERQFGARAGRVDGIGDDFFANTGFAFNENGGPASRGLRGNGQCSPKGGGRPDNFLER